ncbi:spore germination protein [Paenibacillus sp. JX-17]|uniref:Spore germination protein n=1 Tax=Paenibacillus lacisoli TaxID=3064525 RepID=A0ABT9CHK9_9BACL|nr:spore germination protein [Paenibacillus sp. JX-17]MDO7908063.1 spore germination protein [Paenibacillus sp. JX-17]
MWKKWISHIPDASVFVQSFILLIVPILLFWLAQWCRNMLNSGLQAQDPDPPDERNKDAQSGMLSESYDDNVKIIKKRLGMNADFKTRELLLKGTDLRICIFTVSGLFGSDLIDTHLLTPLMRYGLECEKNGEPLQDPEQMKNLIRNTVLPVTQISETESFSIIEDNILTGIAVMLMEGMQGAFLVGSPNGKTRGVEEPVSESLLRGPRVGFNESLSDNMGLLRMQGVNESMVFTEYEVGSRLKRKMVLAYLKDVADPELVREVDSRIKKIHIDAALDSGYIEQLIEDDVVSPFQQMHNTERPDRVISALLEGRVAVLLSGSPFALVMPVTFTMLLQSPEDYYERWIPGSFLRLLRFLAAMLALLAPAIYISFISFLPGLIPTKLALTIIETRQGVPFPSIIEALIMEISIEILREAGIRLPRPIGPAMGIVGGLIIGQAAVQAGIVSQFLVIVVAVTAISSFAIPVYTAGITLRILRFAAMFSAAVFGLYGLVMFVLLIGIHLVRLKSFGVPYVSPAAPYQVSDWKDFLIRLPLKYMRKRPVMLNPKDKDRR